MGVSTVDRHTLQHIRTTCNCQPLELMLIKRAFQWLGHVARMPATRYPAMVFDCKPAGGKRQRGRPKGTFKHTHMYMLEKLGVNNPQQWLNDMHENAQDRVSWRAVVKGFEFPEPNSTAPQRTRPYLGRASKRRVA